jgi:hypothetical protein
MRAGNGAFPVGRSGTANLPRWRLDGRPWRRWARRPPTASQEPRARIAAGAWIFHTISADVEDRFEAFCGQETDVTGWSAREEMRSLSLHPELQLWLDP